MRLLRDVVDTFSRVATGGGWHSLCGCCGTWLTHVCGGLLRAVVDTVCASVAGRTLCGLLRAVVDTFCAAVGGRGGQMRA
eukprot:11621345-Prorocentrum_lima.AAC.1